MAALMCRHRGNERRLRAMVAGVGKVFMGLASADVLLSYEM